MECIKYQLERQPLRPKGHTRRQVFYLTLRNKMNSKQKTAIRKIEEAMKFAESLGLVFAGVDTNLIVFSGKEFYKLSKTKGNVSPGEVINELNHVDIDCNYIDSCAT